MRFRIEYIKVWTHGACFCCARRSGETRTNDKEVPNGTFHFVTSILFMAGSIFATRWRWMHFKFEPSADSFVFSISSDCAADKCVKTGRQKYYILKFFFQRFMAKTQRNFKNVENNWIEIFLITILLFFIKPPPPNLHAVHGQNQYFQFNLCACKKSSMSLNHRFTCWGAAHSICWFSESDKMFHTCTRIHIVRPNTCTHVFVFARWMSN